MSRSQVKGGVSRGLEREPLVTLHVCTERDLPARMNEIQWQAMWRYYVLPGHLKRADGAFAGSAESSGFLLDGCLIAVDDGEDAGFCWGALRGSDAWCGGFGVRPEFRRRGLGKALLQGTADALKAHGATLWRLEVVQQNTAALESYLRTGFVKERDLGLYRGRLNVPLAAGEAIREAVAGECLARYQAGWPQVRRTWGAAPAQLRANADKYAAKELVRDGEPLAFLLHSGGSVVDVGLQPGTDPLSGVKLIASLPSFSINNLPADDPVRSALDAQPGAHCWVKQWELAWPL